MSKIKVFHVEDYKVAREGIRHLLSTEADIEVVGEARNGEEFLKALESIEVDVLILDLYLDAMWDLNAMNGFQVCRVLQDQYPHVKIVVHSVYDDADRVTNAFKCGALGFVSKKSGFDELVYAVRAVYKGDKYICHITAGRLKNLNEFLMGLEDSLTGKDELFSPREKEVLTLLSQGKSSKEISDSLFISERTVESHRKNMVEKAKVKNSAELIAYAAAIGIIKK